MGRRPSAAAGLAAGDDPFKLPSSRNELRDEFGDRVTVVVVPNASHALLPEAPDAVAEAMTHASMSARVAKKVYPNVFSMGAPRSSITSMKRQEQQPISRPWSRRNAMPAISLGRTFSM